MSIRHPYFKIFLLAFIATLFVGSADAYAIDPGCGTPASISVGTTCTPSVSDMTFLSPTGTCDPEGVCIPDATTTVGAFGPINLDAMGAKAGFDPTDFTSKIVYCVKAMIKQATITFLSAMSDFMEYTTTVVMVFAVALFGIKILAGEEQLTAKTVGFLLRLALVTAFSYNLNGFAAASYSPFNILDELLQFVSEPVGGSGCSNPTPNAVWPWCQVDHFLGRLMGFGKNDYGGQILLFQGFLGIISAALFSASTGIALFMAGLSALLNLVFFVFELVFSYLMSVTAIAFLIIISPIIIPMAMFSHTEQYFSKWLNQMISAILGPVLLFGFLTMALPPFEALITNAFAVVGNTFYPDMSSYVQGENALFSWTQQVDPNLRKNQKKITNGTKSFPPTPPNIDEHGASATDTGPLNLFSINFGPNNINIIQNLVLAFVALWVYASMLKSMIEKIPNITEDIATSMSFNRMKSAPFGERLQETLGNLKFGAGALLGGIAGGEAGAALAKKAHMKNPGVAREAGGITGGLLGGLIGNRL